MKTKFIVALMMFLLIALPAQEQPKPNVIVTPCVLFITATAVTIGVLGAFVIIKFSNKCLNRPPPTNEVQRLDFELFPAAIQRSSNLIDWETILVTNITLGGEVALNNQPSHGCFYRVVSP